MMWKKESMDSYPDPYFSLILAKLEFSGEEEFVGVI
jgi:hypothetical protein